MMGVEARFQAMPENCDLFIAARQEREIAEALQFFHRLAFAYKTPHPMWDAKWQEAYGLAQKLGAEKPDLINRYFYAGGRTFDAIVYLLSPVRRNLNLKEEDSLIYQAVYGQELLHPKAHASQGWPIGLVTAAGVVQIAEYLSTIREEMLIEYYHPKHMYEAGAYKMDSAARDGRFAVIWDEFVGMREVYLAAAYNGEAVITVID
jgi:hypothetical protein